MDGSDGLKDHMKRKHGKFRKKGKNEEREESGKIEEERKGWFWTGQGAVFTCWPRRGSESADWGSGGQGDSGWKSGVCTDGRVKDARAGGTGWESG